MIPSYAKESRATHTHRPPVSPPPKPKANLKQNHPSRGARKSLLFGLWDVVLVVHTHAHIWRVPGRTMAYSFSHVHFAVVCWAFVSFAANEIKPPYFVFFFGETGRVPGLAAIFSSVKPFFKFLMSLPRGLFNAVKSTNPNTRSRAQQEKEREREREWQNAAAQPPPANTSPAGCC